MQEEKRKQNILLPKTVQWQVNVEFPRFNLLCIAIRFEHFLGVTEFYPYPGYLSVSKTEKPTFIWSVSW